MRLFAQWMALFVFLGFSTFAQAQYVPLVPARLLDTRPAGTTIDSQFAPASVVASKATLNLTVTGRDGIPSDAKAVALNVTVTDPTAAAGFLTVWPTGSVLPTASTLNFVSGKSISNLVVAKIGTNGQVSFYNGSPGTLNVVADVTGYFVSSSDFIALTPARLLDTRAGRLTVDGQFQGAGPLGLHVSLDLQALNRGGVPAGSVSAVVLNVTVTGPTAATFVTAWPTGNTRPLTSNLNAVAGQTVANAVVVGIGTGGSISLYNNQGSSDLVVDVLGYFPTSNDYTALQPTRLIDTRSGTATTDNQYAGIGALGSNASLNMNVLGRGGVPAAGVAAIALNLTAVSPTLNGYLTAWGTATTNAANAPPLAMAVNYGTGDLIPSLVFVPVGANGQISIYNSAGATQVVADVVGWIALRPVIASFNPTSGPAGTVVTISGANFTPSSLVNFNGTNAHIEAVSSTSLTVTVQPGTSTGAIAVTSAGSTTHSATPFTVKPDSSSLITPICKASL